MEWVDDQMVLPTERKGKGNIEEEVQAKFFADPFIEDNWFQQILVQEGGNPSLIINKWAKIALIIFDYLKGGIEPLQYNS